MSRRDILRQAICLALEDGIAGNTLEPAFVPHVEEDHAVEFVAIENGPATSLSRVHLVVSVPRELNARPDISGR